MNKQNNSIFEYLLIILQHALLLFALLASSVEAAAPTPDPYWQGTLGPLTIRSLSPAQALRLAPIPRSPYGLPDGQTEIHVNAAAASIFIEDPQHYLMDFHFTDSRLAVSRGFDNGWSAEIAFNDRRIVSTNLDEITEEFHDLFGISQNGRSDVPRNDTRLRVLDHGVDLGREIRGSFSQSLELSVQKVLIDKAVNWPALAVNLNMSYETLGDGVIEQGSVDYGVQFSMAQKYAPGYAYANLSLTRFGSDESLGIPLEEHQYSGMLGYEFTHSANQAFIVQYLFSQGVVKNLGALADVSHEIHLGYKWRSRQLLWQAGLVENIVNFDNSPDVAFTFGVTYRL
jgi:hypothetical protein